jgi:hypothetical protein
MPGKIIIDFDDEQSRLPVKPEEEKIIIDLSETGMQAQGGEVNENNVKREFEILNETVSSFYGGNQHLSNFFESRIEFPSGIEKGFSERISLDLKDKFLNSILENNKYMVLSSASGNVYLIDRVSGKPKEKFAFANEVFEKTGVVKDNIIYLNSLNSIYILDENNGEITNKKIYTCGEGIFIWSNLNIIENNLIFLEFDNHDKATLKTLDLKDNKLIEHKFEVKKFITENICVVRDLAAFICDGKFIIYDIKNGHISEHECRSKLNTDLKFMYLKDRIYFTTDSSEIYYFDLLPGNFNLKFTGIKEDYINSIAGNKDFIFTGTLNGWKCYGVNGMPVYDFEDSDENRIEATSENLLIVSKKNRIVLHNLNRFQEAESTVITSEKRDDRIVSSVISKNEVFVLTAAGILRSFTNDLMNIHV